MRAQLPTVLCLLLALFKPVAAEECEARDPTTAEVNSREGVRLAKAGRYREAIALFRLATELDPCAPDHRLLLARALARSDERAEAQTLYQEVMALFPGTPEAERANRELEELKATPEPTKAPDQPISPPPDVHGTLTPPPAGPDWRLFGMISGGVGVLAAAGGVYFALDSKDADDELASASREPDRAHYDDLVDRRSQSRTLAYVLYGLGGALVAGGAVMAFVLPEDAPEGRTEVTLAPGEGGALLLLNGRF